ncbi:YceI family protein [Streptacidiphilus sp. EB103A]|uniref:YceI family protein n=1 Tax=Streptacidiphilus sp. EB103A TaxID=3156275 RepID=UPI003511718E
MAALRTPRHWKRLLIAGIAAIVVLAVGIPFAYIHFFSGSSPAALALPAATSKASTGTTSAGASSSVAGTYTVGSGSQAGYRVSEVLLGQSTTAVGRTSTVTGSLTISGSTLTATSVKVDLRTVTSDKTQRDAQFNGRIMNTTTYPYATFTLSKPVALAPIPAVGTQQKYSAEGDLTMHGQTHPVTLNLTATRTASGIEAVGSIQITFATWGIANPSFGSFVTTGNTGTMEYLLVFTRS